MRFFGQSCDRQLAISCSAAATLSRALKKLELAMTYAKKGCQFGDVEACATEAFLYSRAPFNDPSRAAFLPLGCFAPYARACVANTPSGEAAHGAPPCSFQA